jgi:hypothetical protein
LGEAFPVLAQRGVVIFPKPKTKTRIPPRKIMSGLLFFFMFAPEYG